jgi:hypothetical protein
LLRLRRRILRHRRCGGILRRSRILLLLGLRLIVLGLLGAVLLRRISTLLGRGILLRLPILLRRIILLTGRSLLTHIIDLGLGILLRLLPLLRLLGLLPLVLLGSVPRVEHVRGVSRPP